MAAAGVSCGREREGEGLRSAGERLRRAVVAVIVCVCVDACVWACVLRELWAIIGPSESA